MNMKRIFVTVSIAILIVAYLVSCSNARKTAHISVEPEFTYDIYNEEMRLVSITGLKKGSPVPSKLIIPGTLTIDGKDYTVTTVGGFSGTSIRDVEINFKPFLFQGTVEDEAFRNCRYLRSVSAVSGTIINFGDSCFEECSNLETFSAKVNYPDKGSLLSRPFGENCFKGCAKLKTVVIPDNSRSIAKSAFEGCRSLSNIDLKNIKTIEDRAFLGCFKLRKVHIPDSVSSIGDKAFSRIPEIQISLKQGHGIHLAAFEKTATLIERDAI